MKPRIRFGAILVLGVLAIVLIIISWPVKQVPVQRKMPFTATTSPSPTPAQSTISENHPAPAVAADEEASSLVQTSSTAPTLPVPHSAPPSSPAVAEQSDITPATLPAAVIAPPLPPISEEAGTAMMYAAHASLRTPEFADPDSASNKKALQSMLAKSLATGASTPPTPGTR